MFDVWWSSLDDDRERLLARLRAVIGEHTGLKFPPERWSYIERAAELVGRQQGFADARGWFEWFLATPPTLAHLEPLVAHLTIGETYFFRDKPLFKALRERLLPALVERRRDGSRCVRIWSAGCSTGEEPYSIAITLQRALPEWRTWHLTVLATDINPQALAKASAGRYESWSFRGGLPQPHDTEFERIDARTFAVAPRVRTMVRFAQLNLVDDMYPGAGFDALDIIFCRNVLMYLDPPRARAVIKKLADALVDGGWLVLAAVESSLVDVPGLHAVRLEDLILYQKRSDVTAETPPPSSLARSAPMATATMSLAPTSWVPPLERAAQRVVEPVVAPPPAPVVAPRRDAELLIEHARHSADHGRLAEAAQYCTAAIAADKLNPEWTDLHASILLEQGAVEAAEKALKRTLYLDQDRVLTHVRLANLLWGEERRRAEGRRHFRTALELLDERDERDALSDTDGMTVAQLRTLIQTAIAHDVAGTYGTSA